MQIIIVLITGIFVALVAYVTDWLGKDIKVKSLLVGSVAIVTGLCGIIYDKYDESSNRPSVNVQITVTNNSMNIEVKPDDKQSLQSIKLSFNLPFRIKNVSNDNILTDGKADVVVLGGTDLGYLTNRLDIDILQVHPNRSLHFLVTFDKVKEVSFEYIGKDTVEMNYVWSYKAHIINESEWINIYTNKKVKRPIADLGVIIFNGNARVYDLWFNLRANGGLEKNERTQVINVLSVEKDFSSSVNHEVIPRRSY